MENGIRLAQSQSVVVVAIGLLGMCAQFTIYRFGVGVDISARTGVAHFNSFSQMTTNLDAVPSCYIMPILLNTQACTVTMTAAETMETPE